MGHSDQYTCYLGYLIFSRSMTIEGPLDPIIDVFGMFQNLNDYSLGSLNLEKMNCYFKGIL